MGGAQLAQNPFRSVPPPVDACQAASEPPQLQPPRTPVRRPRCRAVRLPRRGRSSFSGLRAARRICRRRRSGGAAQSRCERSGPVRRSCPARPSNSRVLDGTGHNNRDLRWSRSPSCCIPCGCTRSSRQRGWSTSGQSGRSSSGSIGSRPAEWYSSRSPRDLDWTLCAERGQDNLTICVGVAADNG